MRAFRDGVLRGVKKIFKPDAVPSMEQRAAALLARFPVSEDGKFALVNACESFLGEFRGCAQPSGDLCFWPPACWRTCAGTTRPSRCSTPFRPARSMPPNAPSTAPN
ncbi:hypothetical protein HK414_04580 [Ramlibacter terrae]|uniref:Uncharacterized protein n=1 Tax=Ramlibacter terrae TaxID=2732511 RepID=A0ABX6P3A7_9BURK|nr:hypothetical protein HK414_04580 [Ramlibacter terrae]